MNGTPPLPPRSGVMPCPPPESTWSPSYRRFIGWIPERERERVFGLPTPECHLALAKLYSWWSENGQPVVADLLTGEGVPPWLLPEEHRRWPKLRRPLPHDNEDEIPWHQNPWRNPPLGDKALREAERRYSETGTESDELRYLVALTRAGRATVLQEARRRQLAGELGPVGTVFLGACESWGWEGTRSRLEPHRVEGKRLALVNEGQSIAVGRSGHHMTTRPAEIVMLPVSLRQDSMFVNGRPRTYTAILAEPILVNGGPAWQDPHRQRWQTGTQTAWLIDESQAGLHLVPHDAVWNERFYVVPSSYPMYRGWDDLHALTDTTFIREACEQRGIEYHGDAYAPRALESAIHLEAVQWYVQNGAVLYTLPETEDIARIRREFREGGIPVGVLPSDTADYLNWWESYRQRVLVGVVNKQGASRFPSGHMVERLTGHYPGSIGAPDHNTKILIPKFWERARIMERVGKDGKRWKNNPDRSLRSLQRHACSSGSPFELADYARARARAGEDVLEWETSEVGQVFHQAFRLGQDGRVEAVRRDDGKKERFYLAANRLPDRGDVNTLWPLYSVPYNNRPWWPYTLWRDWIRRTGVVVVPQENFWYRGGLTSLRGIASANDLTVEELWEANTTSDRWGVPLPWRSSDGDGPRGSWGAPLRRLDYRDPPRHITWADDDMYVWWWRGGGHGNRVYVPANGRWSVLFKAVKSQAGRNERFEGRGVEDTDSLRPSDYVSARIMRFQGKSWKNNPRRIS